MECFGNISELENAISAIQSDIVFIGIIFVIMAFIIGVMYEKIWNGEKLI